MRIGNDYLGFNYFSANFYNFRTFQLRDEGQLWFNKNLVRAIYFTYGFTFLFTHTVYTGGDFIADGHVV